MANGELIDQAKIAAYAYRHWIRAGMTEWPTVRQTARALKIRQADIDQGADLYTITGYNFDDDNLGDHFVVADLPEVEVAWCGYWLPYSHGCYCGTHDNAQGLVHKTCTDPDDNENE